MATLHYPNPDRLFFAEMEVESEFHIGLQEAPNAKTILEKEEQIWSVDTSDCRRLLQIFSVELA